MTSPGPICHGEKCQHYQKLNIGAGCWQKTPVGSLFCTEWTRLDRLKRCPGFVEKGNGQG